MTVDSKGMTLGSAQDDGLRVEVMHFNGLGRMARGAGFRARIPGRIERARRRVRGPGNEGGEQASKKADRHEQSH